MATETDNANLQAIINTWHGSTYPLALVQENMTFVSATEKAAIFTDAGGHKLSIFRDDYWRIEWPNGDEMSKRGETWFLGEWADRQQRLL